MRCVDLAPGSPMTFACPSAGGRVARRLLVTVLLVGHVLLAPAVWGNEVAKPPDPKALDQTIDRVDAELKRGTESEDRLRDWAKQINAVRGDAAECVSTTDQQLQKLQQDIKSLGPPVQREPPEVAQKRRAMAQQQSDLEKNIANCRLLLLRSDDALGRINTLQQQLLAQRLLSRGPTFTALLKDNWQQPALWLTSTKNFLLKQLGDLDFETK